MDEKDGKPLWEYKKWAIRQAERLAKDAIIAVRRKFFRTVITAALKEKSKHTIIADEDGNPITKSQLKAHDWMRYNAQLLGLIHEYEHLLKDHGDQVYPTV